MTRRRPRTYSPWAAIKLGAALGIFLSGLWIAWHEGYHKGELSENLKAASSALDRVIRRSYETGYRHGQAGHKRATPEAFVDFKCGCLIWSTAMPPKPGVQADAL